MVRRTIMVIGGIAFCVAGLRAPSAEAHTLADEPPPPKVAALLNLDIQRSLVHLFCDRSQTACKAEFYCGGRDIPKTDATGCLTCARRPVEWEVSIQPDSIFGYWPNRTTSSGDPDGFGDAYRSASGSTARGGRTTCIVRSNDPVEARGYTWYGGSQMYVPASNRIHPPEPYPSARLSGLTVSGAGGTLSPAFASSTGTYTLTTTAGLTEGSFSFTPTAEESRAEIKVGTWPVESGEPSRLYEVSTEELKITIAVTSYDGHTINYYVNYN